MGCNMWSFILASRIWCRYVDINVWFRKQAASTCVCVCVYVHMGIVFWFRRDIPTIPILRGKKNIQTSRWCFYFWRPYRKRVSTRVSLTVSCRAWEDCGEVLQRFRLEEWQLTTASALHVFARGSSRFSGRRRQPLLWAHTAVRFVYSPGRAQPPSPLPG